MSDKEKETTEDFSGIVLSENIKVEESSEEDEVKDITDEIIKEVEDLKEIDFKGLPKIREVKEGVITFKIENSEILKALQVFKSVEYHSKMTNIIFILGKRVLTFVNTYDRDLFAKVRIPLMGESSVKDGHIGFKVPFNFLFQTVSRQGSEETLSYKYEVGAKKFSICLADGDDINITAEKNIKGDITAIVKESKIEVKKVQEVENIDALKAGLKYISLFVKTCKENVCFEIVEIKDDMVYGGNVSTAGIFQSEKLKGLDFKIPGKATLDAVVRLLDTFLIGGMGIWESKDGHYLYITDGRGKCIRYTKETYGFPAERESVLCVDVSKRIITPRLKLIESMDSLSYVSDELELTVDTENEKYFGKVLDYCGLSSVRNFEAKASGEKVYQETLISIDEFLKVLKYFDSANVEICFHMKEKELIVILDEIEDYNVKTIIVADDREGSYIVEDVD